MLKTPIKRNPQGRFALKNDDYRSVRSLRLTDFTWQALGAAAEALLLTRADLLEQMFRAECWRGNILPQNLFSNDARYGERGTAGGSPSGATSVGGFPDIRKVASGNERNRKGLPLWAHLNPGNTPQSGNIQSCTTEIKVDCQPCITRSDEEIRLKAEVQYLSQQNAWLREQVAVGLPLVPLEVRRDALTGSVVPYGGFPSCRTTLTEYSLLSARVLKNLKLGKQAPKYKAIQKALEHFIALLTTQQSN